MNFFSDLEVATIKKNAAEEKVIQLYQQISDLMKQIDAQTIVVDQYQEQLKDGLPQIGQQWDANMKSVCEKVQKIALSDMQSDATASVAEIVNELHHIGALLVENIRISSCAQNLHTVATKESELLQQNQYELQNLKIELMQKKQEICAAMVEIAAYDTTASEYLDKLNGANYNYKDALTKLTIGSDIGVDLLRSKFDAGDIPTIAYIQNDGTVWSAPCVYTRISSPFGYRVHPITGKWSMHNGVDLPNKAKTPIRATRSGVVTYSGYNDISGYYVVVEHLDGTRSCYLHMYQKSDLSIGDVVIIGDYIGGMGTTGRSTGVHLHFGIKKDGEFVDPMNYIAEK